MEKSPENGSITLTGAIQHVVVVGFHHKKGCVVEYSYPPLVQGEPHDSPSLPEEWKYLPFLALPDGAHNYTEDLIYFHLPTLEKDANGLHKTVYCVSCYRQIDTKLLKNKDPDVTRGTVQKSVVVLCKYPIFGLLHAKLQLITHAYFEEKDFSQKHILQELYNDINMSLGNIDESCIFVGLSSRNLVQNFNHKIVVLFKLILLERRVMFFGSPVRKLVGSIMALLSLYPGMLDCGLSLCTNIVEYKREEHIPENETKTTEVKESEINIEQNTTSMIGEFQEQSKQISNVKDIQEKQVIQVNVGSNRNENSVENKDESAFVLSTLKTEEEMVSTPMRLWSVTSDKARDVAHTLTERLESMSSIFSESDQVTGVDDLSSFVDLEQEAEDEVPNFGNARLEMQHESPTDLSITRTVPLFESKVASIPKRNYKGILPVNEYGFPLSIFTDGHLCMPYVALQQHSILENNIEKGFVGGATNMLFKTHTHMTDIIVDIETFDLIFHNQDLRRLLHLSSADLRFAEHLVSHVGDRGSEDIFLDATGWEGGEEWLQAQFAEYLRSLLSFSTQVCPNPKDSQDFNEHFLAAWKQTKNYQIWQQGKHNIVIEENLSHPFRAQYSVSDVKLRIHHNLQSSERGRKIEGAVSNANQVVSNTGKFIGSSLTSAKSSMTSWLSKFNNTNGK